MKTSKPKVESTTPIEDDLYICKLIYLHVKHDLNFNRYHLPQDTVVRLSSCALTYMKSAEFMEALKEDAEH